MFRGCHNDAGLNVTFENRLWRFVSECVVWKRVVTIGDWLWRRLALRWLDDVMIGWEQRTQYQSCTLMHFKTLPWRQETFHHSTNDDKTSVRRTVQVGPGGIYSERFFRDHKIQSFSEIFLLINSEKIVKRKIQRKHSLNIIRNSEMYSRSEILL
jgi:hypothetical protein